MENVDFIKQRIKTCELVIANSMIPENVQQFTEDLQHLQKELAQLIQTEKQQREKYDAISTLYRNKQLNYEVENENT